MLTKFGVAKTMKNKLYLLVLSFFSFIFSACAPTPPDLSGLSPVPINVDCEDTSLLTIPEDPSVRGPWPVGQKTVQLGRLTAEIWYPATPGSESNQQKVSYDLRQFLPDADAAKIPDDAGLDQPCDCYADLPLDMNFGPYPVIVLIHGTAAFRTASLPLVTHWASRGFVVVSADNPSIYLKDAKANVFGVAAANQAQDTVAILEALQNTPAELSFLNGYIDVSRIGMSGHSAGGNAAAFFADAPGVRTIIPLAAGGTSSGTYLKSSMVIGSENDGVVAYSGQVSGYANSPSPKRLVGIGNTGHLVYTELCSLGAEQGGLIPLVESYGVDVPFFFRDLGTDGCGDDFLASEDGWTLINYASTAAFEEVLQCNAASAQAFDTIEDRFPQLFEFEQDI